MMVTIFWIAFGGIIGFLLGLNHVQSSTFVFDQRRLELENKELQNKVDFYKKTIKELVESNKSLVKELENK